jgi:basic amino acid/polyamine antiporter, APA family
MLFSMARGGDMPSWFARLLPKRQTPWLAALGFLVASALFLPLGEVAVVASLSSFASLLAFCAVQVIVVILRYREPDRERPFRVPLSIGRLPVLPVLGICSAVVLAFQFERRVYLVGLLVILIGIGLYWTQRFWKNPSQHKSSAMGEQQAEMQKQDGER